MERKGDEAGAQRRMEPPEGTGGGKKILASGERNTISSSRGSKTVSRGRQLQRGARSGKLTEEANTMPELKGKSLKVKKVRSGVS